MKLLAILIPLFLVQVVLSAEPDKSATPAASPSVDEIIERTKRDFPKARFFKPRAADDTRIEHKLAPLIVEEWTETIHGESPKLGTDFYSRRLAKAGTVLYASAQAIAHGRRLDQVVFLWWYGLNKQDSCGLHTVPRGIRIITGPDGTPVVWEALSDSSGTRIFFVSQTIEIAAKEEFGEPLPGRKFSIERSLEDAGNIVVAAIIEDGPIPMGPYVYVEASEQRSISTIHCRCSTSQFAEAVETIVYELFPLDTLDVPWLRNHGVDEDKLFAPEPLDKLFRWPKN